MKQTPNSDDKDDDFDKLLAAANEASLKGDQERANDLINQLLDLDKDKLK